MRWPTSNTDEAKVEWFYEDLQDLLELTPKIDVLFIIGDWNAKVGSQGKPFNITIIQVYAPTSNAEEAEVKWFYEDLQDLLELTPPKDVLFIIGDWNAKVGSQELPGVPGKFGLGVQNKAGQKLRELCQEDALVIANTLLQQHKRRLYTWTSSDGQTHVFILI